MFNKKYLMLSIFLLSLLTLSVVSASDNATEVISLEESNDAISIGETQAIGQSEDDTLIDLDGGTFSDLQRKIDNANASSTITLENNYTYDDGFNKDGILISKEITIEGNGFTIDASKTSRIFNVTSTGVVFKNIIFTNGHAEGNGGAISGSATAIGCTFNKNYANGDGGAIYNVNAEGCTFSGNCAEYRGGGIYNGNATDCTFTDNNYAGQAGGGMHTGDALNCIFTGNGAKDQGAAMYGGNAINTQLAGYVHAFAHSIGATYHLSHGQAISLMLLPVLEFQQDACQAQYKVLAEYCGVPDFLQAIRELMAKCEMDKIESPVRSCDHERLIPMIAADSINYSAPVTLTNDEIRQVLNAVTRNQSAAGEQYSVESISAIVAAQRKFFMTGETLPVKWRIKQLKRLKEAVLAHQDELIAALREDLGRSEVEAYLCDIGPIITEVNEMISGLRRWARPERHFSGLMCWPSVVTKVYKMPYGVSLVISPFNFPVLLTIGVVAAAMCGGNTVVVKSSSKSAASTAALKKFFAQVFPPEYITLIDGGHDVADMCLAQRFDKIFYTGSPSVGKHVLAEAAKNLTPVALELGGETGNWCVVRKDADLTDAARKIAFFKLLNAGQICININQIAVAEEVAEEFVKELKAAFIAQIGEHAETNPEYPKLITDAAFDKCAKLADEYRDRIVFGGVGNPQTRQYAPTIIYPVEINEHIVQHELFCPLLPIVPFKDAEVDELMDVIAEREHPLAMYLFTQNMKWANRVMQTQQFGGGCINEVCVHMMVKGVPFNGTGHSGMGAYHGEWGFREFTHPQTVLKGSTHFNLSLREHPYTGSIGETKRKILRLFER